MNRSLLTMTVTRALPATLMVGFLVGACRNDEATKAAPKQAEETPAASDAPAAPAPHTREQKRHALGSERADPPWFRKDFAAGWTAEDFSRTAADEEGRFSSRILFSLPADVTPAQCVDAMREQVGSSLPDLRVETQADGRFILRGTTDRYEFSGMCGQVEGKTKAYISFNWTS